MKARCDNRGRMTQRQAARSSDRFDLLMGTLSLLLIAGVIQDGWAHNHGKVDESFFTPWHFVLYGMMALSGIALAVTGLRGLRRGYRFADAIPYGYWSSAIGVIIFIVGGALDLAWHELFGVEASIDALVSPTHLILALGAALVCSGPIRSVAHRYGASDGGWRRIGPAVLAIAGVTMLVGFFTQYVQPIGDDGIASVVAKSDDAPVVQGLYFVDAGGSQRRLFPSADQDQFGPSTSPDGRRIVFRALENGSPASDLYVGAVGGGAPVRITHSGRHDTQPAWSPDGRWIAFVSAPAGTSGEFQLNVVRPDGSGLRTVTHGVTTIAGPAWSPDSTRIAIGSRNGVDDQVAIVDVLSGRRTWVNGANGSWPAWSRDGGRIYFAKSDAEGNPASVDVVSAGGGADSVVVEAATMPAISADGKQLAFVRAEHGTDQVFVSPIDGAGAQARDVSRLSGLDASRPAWAGPDGLVFVASGRARPSSSDYALALSLSGVLVQAMVVSGAMLLLVRRWRPPVGAVTLVLTAFAVAMATQNDDYFGVWAALLAGVCADVALALTGENGRRGLGLYALGFGVPFVLTALYTLFVGIERGIGWPPNMVAGSPFIAGVAGLFVAFAFEPPLERTPAG